MFGDGEDTPTRCELLSMVKKHSSLNNGKPTTSTTTTVAAARAHADDDGVGDGDEDDASDDVEMDSNFWHDVLDLYFVRGTNSRKSHEEDSDDLIFFVRKLNLHGYGFNDNMDGGAPYFVRRWAPKLDKLVGESSGDVDWRRSFYLNLIAHTSFTVTVAICSHQVLQNHQTEKDTPLSPIYKVVKTVYASPSRVNFHLDSRKEVKTTPAYPEICFAIDDFDSTFDAVVLTDTDHCYCVLLNAHEGAAFPSEKAPNKGSSCDISSLTVDTGHAKGKKNKLTLFSGFVSYQMVREAYDAGKSRFGSLLSLGQSIEKADRLYMKGPGGRGEVEVAVSGVTDQSQQPSGPFSPVDAPKRGSGFGTMILKAASVASVAAKQAYAAASRGSDEDNMLPLKCCLMSISLPWEHIAYDLLFKGSPQVNL